MIVNSKARLHGLAQAVRERAPLYLSPETAACADLTIQQLQRLNCVPLAEWQVHALARRMGLEEPAASRSPLMQPPGLPVP